jgi:hypothetical protein
VKGWKRIYQAKGPWKQAGLAILISDNVDIKLTLVKQDKEGHVIWTKCAIHQKQMIIIDLYAPNVSEPNFTKHTLKDIKALLDSKTMVVADLNTHLLPIDRSSKQKVNKES